MNVIFGCAGYEWVLEYHEISLFCFRGHCGLSFSTRLGTIWCILVVIDRLLRGFTVIYNWK